MSVGLQLIAGLIAEGDIVHYRKLSLSDKLFFGPELQLFNYVNGHVQKYNTLPKAETVFSQFQGLPQPVEPIKFYADQVESRYAHKRLNKALAECNELMKIQDSFTAQAVITEALADLRAIQARTSMAEFTEQAHDMYMSLYHKKQLIEELEVKLNWPTLDKFGGLRPGEILAFIGRPALGKTMFLLRCAMEAMRKQKRRILCISMEMSLTEIMERLVALYAKFPMDHIQNYALTTNQQKTLPGILMGAKQEEGKLWILDGNFASTVNDIFSLAYQLNPHAIFIDGAYLLQHEDTRLDRYRKISVNLEIIKKRAQEFGIPVILSYQFNREGAKVEKKSKGTEKAGLEHIFGSDEIGQICSLVLGMFEEESVETIISRNIKVLKGRKGHTGAFRVNWDWLNMDFDEIEDDAKKEKGQLQFV